MVDISSRVQRVIEELAGNESLLGMLEENAASEMLNWGIEISKSIISRTAEMDDFAADLLLLPRLKAVRQLMRSVGNWAAGKYADPATRVQLREKLLEQFKVVFGDDATLPSTEKMDEVLNQVDDSNNTPSQLILNFKHLFANDKENH